MPESRPLRVCVVTRVVNQHGFGGMQQHTDDLVRGLVSEGHDVSLITPRLPGDRTPPPSPDGPGRLRWALANADRPDLPYSREWGAASVAEFRRLVGTEGPFDVVHSESGGALGLIKAGALRSTPLVVNFHGNFRGYVRAQRLAAMQPRPRLRGIARALRRSARSSVIHYGQGHWRAYRNAEAIVPSRSHLRDTIASCRLSPERTHVVPNGVDVGVFRPGREGGLRRDWGVPDDRLLVLTLGRLAQDKGNDVAVRALAAMPERVTLVIAGEGEEREALSALAQDLGLAHRIRLIGTVAQDRVPEAMRAADVFWFPTVRDEAAPLVLPQAMATGLPVVASRIGGIPDVVDRPGEHAALVEPRDPQALAAATLPLVDDAAARARLGEGARRRIVERFSLESMTRGTVDVYRVAIARRRASRDR